MQEAPLVRLPKYILNSHSHARDMEEAYKITLEQIIYESLLGLIAVSVFMPNTKPAMTTIGVLNRYLELLYQAESKNNARNQYVFFGATDDNLADCELALQHDRVVGIKVYPKKAEKKSKPKTITLLEISGCGTISAPAQSGTVTTGSGDIGVSNDDTILALMHLCKKYNKVLAVHCDHPDLVSRNSRNPIEAEVEYVKKIIRLAKMVPGVKITICHVSCRASAEEILTAQNEDLQIMLELAPHYLWFDNTGTNYRPHLYNVFYHCLNNLRGPEDRKYLVGLLRSYNPLISVASDSACHTTEDKMNLGLGGLPTHQHMVAVVVTLATEMNLSDQQVCQLLSWNAADHLGITIAHEMETYALERRQDNAVYNNGKVTNPWLGTELLFPVKIKK